MKNDKLHDAMNYIDDDLIAEVAQIRDTGRRNKRGRRLLASIALAACFCIVVTVFTLGYKGGRAPENAETNNAEGVLGDQQDSDIAGNIVGIGGSSSAENADDKWNDELTEASTETEAAEDEIRQDGEYEEERAESDGVGSFKATLQGYEGDLLVLTVYCAASNAWLNNGDSVYVKPYEDAKYTRFEGEEGSVADMWYENEADGAAPLKKGDSVKVYFDKYDGGERITVYARSFEIY